jgi:mono/diheme cytochrome c family protein
MPGRARWLIACLTAGLMALAAAAVVYLQGPVPGDPADPAQVLAGRPLYAANCASCHGNGLQGQPDWRARLPNGRLPAPPHDVSGHTWHHPDRQLFDMIKFGIERFAPRGYESDMPAYEGKLTDTQIWAILAFIKSTWPPEIRDRQAETSRR